MSKLKVAIIGAGHLGKIHARLAKSNDQFEVVGVVEPVAAARNQVATDLQLPTFDCIDPLIGDINAAIVATPTVYHYDVTSALLRAGVHVLVEKPLASSADQADRLVQIAKRHDLFCKSVMSSDSTRVGPLYNLTWAPPNTSNACAQALTADAVPISASCMT